MQGSRIAFGPFVLDPAAGTLLRNNVPVAIGYRALKLLAALAGRPGEIIGKGELMDAAWPGRAVEEGNLTVQIAHIRKLLGPAGEGGGEWIATIARVGYRFIGAVEQLGDGVRQPVRALGKPSIAVLPFVNAGDDPGQGTFVEGLTEDLTTDLSRISGLFVVARSTLLADRADDVRRAAQDLGVRYLLEGSARWAGERARINAQLVDAMSGEHLWAERFDLGMDDVFAVQDEVTGKIVAAIFGRLGTQLPRRQSRDPEAFELCLRARKLMDDTPQAAREAQLMLMRAVSLDPDNAEAYRWLAMNRWMGWVHSGGPTEIDRAAALGLARKAVALDPGDAGCRWVLAYLLAYERKFAEADAEFERAMEIDPNEADAWAALSDITVLAGRIEQGLEYIRKAFRLNPFPASWYYLALGQAQYASRDYETAIETLSRDETYRTSSRRFLAASLAQLGRLDEARAEADLFLVSNPDFTISHWAAMEPFRDAATLDHFVDGCRKAGFPE